MNLLTGNKATRRWCGKRFLSYSNSGDSVVSPVAASRRGLSVLPSDQRANFPPPGERASSVSETPVK
ncbi:MAG: hypothetical protein JW913_09155 [Chitinispirillaceae bacterium]|nr:hypothetical protein [Chitinispirillaceae bacterium]